jgi:hypothetical protein
MVTFDANNVEFYLNEIRNGKLSEFDPVNGTFHLGIAVLEYDWIDVELNLQSANEPDGDGYTCEPSLSYFCCVKGTGDDGESYWMDAGYLDDFGYDVEVDWSGNDWAEQLRNDMERKLKAFAELHDLKYNMPNFDEREHEWDVFDKIHNSYI